MEQRFIERTEKLLAFIAQSKSVYHAIAQVRENCMQCGYELTDENLSGVKLCAGGKYVTTRNDSSLIAIHMPDNLSNVKGFHITASHADSPTFKVKENPEMEVEAHYTKLNTEKYGGMIISGWFDRPLSVAGRIFYEKDGTLQSELVDIDKDLCVIPSLAIHMNPKINEENKYNAQKDTLPLMGMNDGKSLKKIIAENMHIEPDEILGSDLFLYVRQEGRVAGADSELVVSPKLDDLQCVYSCKEAFLNTKPHEYINVLVVFDNEEVGSSTRQGADSDLLVKVLGCVENKIKKFMYEEIVDEKTMQKNPMPEQIGEGHAETQCDELVQHQKELCMSDHFMLSCDNAHGVHPNYPEKADPTNRPYLNGGVVIKYHGNMKYTTDGFSGAKVKQWCKRADVPYQTYANRSDIAGGSTLGNIALSHISVPSADIGLPQLAMHSCMETGGTKDTEYMVQMLQQFYAE